MDISYEIDIDHATVNTFIWITTDTRSISDMFMQVDIYIGTIWYSCLNGKIFG